MTTSTDLICPLCTCPLPMGLEAGDETSCPDCGEPLVVDWSDRRMGLEAYRDPAGEAHRAASGWTGARDVVEAMEARRDAAMLTGRWW